MNFDVKIYNSFLKVRMKLFKPILFILTKLHITANILSLVSILIMLPSFYYIDIRPEIVVILYFFGVFVLDILDGPLARYQKLNNDKGKFIDVVKDYIVFAIFTIALLKGEFIDVFWGSIFLFLTIIFDISGIIYKAIHTTTNWFFYSSSSFFSTSFLYALPILFLLELLFRINLIENFIIFLDIAMIIGTIYYFIKILNSDKKKTMERLE